MSLADSQIWHRPSGATDPLGAVNIRQPLWYTEIAGRIVRSDGRPGWIPSAAFIGRTAATAQFEQYGYVPVARVGDTVHVDPDLMMDLGL